jgi:hypothetical protein
MQRLNRLTARAVATLKKPRRHADGGGLYLKIDKSGAKRWTFMWMRARLHGKPALALSRLLRSRRREPSECGRIWQRSTIQSKAAAPSARQKNNEIIATRRREILERHALASWKKNRKRKGNAEGTMKEIAEAVLRDLKAADPRENRYRRANHRVGAEGAARKQYLGSPLKLALQHNNSTKNWRHSTTAP